MPAQQVKVLAVDDSDTPLKAIKLILDASGYEVRTHKGPGKDMDPVKVDVASVIRDFRPDVLLLDFEMGYRRGDYYARLVRSLKSYEQPVILFVTSRVLTSEQRKDLAPAEALQAKRAEDEVRKIGMEAGADGCVGKGDLKSLPGRIEAALKIREAKNQQARIAELDKRAVALAGVRS